MNRFVCNLRRSFPGLMECSCHKTTLKHFLLLQGFYSIHLLNYFNKLRRAIFSSEADSWVYFAKRCQIVFSLLVDPHSSSCIFLSKEML